MVKCGVGQVDTSSAFTLCTSSIVSASQPRYWTAGKTRCEPITAVNDTDDDRLSPGITATENKMMSI